MNRFLDIRGHFCGFAELLSLLIRHRRLTLEMAKREIKDRYLGQVFGVFWTIGHPLFIMLVFVFIFGFVFRARLGDKMPLDFTVYLLSGLIPWMGFQESMAKGTSAIVGNANLVKQVVFPIEVLPVKGVLASLLSMGVSFVLLIVYVLIAHHYVYWIYLLLPLVIFCQTIAMIGTSFVLSSVGVYFKDLKDFVQVFSFAGLYLVPILFLPSQVPQPLRPLFYANPFSYLIWCYQDTLYFGRFEHWWAWIVLVPMSFAVFYLGYRVFKSLKVMFGNVL